MTMAKFEKRFTGKDNEGLRAEIRKAVKAARADGRDVATAIESIGRRVALTASGRHTLAAVAEDYANEQ
jgi:hypothetical protein